MGRRGPQVHRLRAVLRRVDPRPRPPQGDRGHPARRPATAPPTARPPSARCCWPRRSATGCPASSRCGWSSSGTEAAMSAIRLARGATGRSRIVKFAGCYHGHSDALLAGGGSGVATLGPARTRPACPTSGGGRDGRGALQRRARGRRPTWPRSSSSRSPPTWAWSRPRPGSSRGCGPPATGRRAADLRRGHHRLPARLAAAPRSATACAPT